ncbi:hypothetical protein B296_00019447 [Ensete ventricosum]|uniref:Multifunctional methyltransferase subunit TRM112-like protein n=1 Tax=Ensete ventricosum TaxID=4639 RepID=A0A427AH74_ENSVE|nr:hypothetical protein B296_00019447 [Ensete ventricosum]
MSFYSECCRSFLLDNPTAFMAYHAVVLFHHVRCPYNEAFAGRGCRPYLCQVGYTSTGATPYFRPANCLRWVGHVDGPAVRGYDVVATWARCFPYLKGPKSSIDRAEGGGGKMRLLTHNMLSCNIKGVANGFPLRLEAEKWVEKEVELNADFLRHIFPKIEWKALSGAARAVGYCELPEEADAAMLDSEDFLRRFHHALLEIHVEEGALFCPETGRRFPITKGIPNMLLHEDEV